jgi:hypothetical protein
MKRRLLLDAAFLVATAELTLACSQTERDDEARALLWHADEFARRMHLSQHICTLPSAHGYRCSGVLNGRPVIFDCDGRGCSFEVEMP